MTNKIEELFKKGVMVGTFGRKPKEDGEEGSEVFMNVDMYTVTGNRRGNQNKIGVQAVGDTFEECLDHVIKGVDAQIAIKPIIPMTESGIISLNGKR